jgi:hypothetical protein
LAVALAVLAAASCDDPFSPIATSEVKLSVFGYLDAAADTQWVRVMPIRSLMLTSPDPFEGIVTLEHLGSGRVFPLRDSVFLFTHHQDPELGSEGAYVHNFWTTEDIEPGATYRFIAREDGQEASEAMVEIPDDFEVEVRIAQNWYTEDHLILEGVEHVPFVSANAHFYDRCGESVDSVRVRERTWIGTGYAMTLRKEEVTPREGCGSPGVERRELWIVASRSEWPSGAEYSPWALAVPEGISNITNAVGFLGGVLTKVVPYETCAFQGSGELVPDECRLRYGPESVTFQGTVVETRCGDGPLEFVTVELREIDGNPPGARKVRTVLTDRAGWFQIGALEAGVRYSLKARAKPEPDPFWGEVDIHTIHTDTLEFSVGETREYDVELRRLTVCGSGS